MPAEPTPCPNCGHRKGEQPATTVHVNIQSVDPRELGRAIREAVRRMHRGYGIGWR